MTTHTKVFTAIVTAATAIAFAGCSDPSRPTAQAAFTATFGNYQANACPAKSPSPQVGIGAVSGTERASIADGEDGAYVSCRVSADGDKLSASGEIRQGNTSFQLFPLEIVRGKTAQGKIQISSASTLGRYAPPDGEPCQINLVDGDAGRIWLSFTCSHVLVSGSPNSDCSLYDGYVVFENCDE